MNHADKILTIEKLKIGFRIGNKYECPVEDVKLDLYKHGVTVIVGRSGSGKSLTSSSLLGLVRGVPGVTDGTIHYEDDDLDFFVEKGIARIKEKKSGKESYGEKAYLPIRGRKISLIFQEHKSALNPLLPIGAHLSDTLLRHKKCDKGNVLAASLNWLQKVQIGSDDAERRKIIDMFPCQLSGGLSQRLMIALALCTEPQILIADEPTTNIDASLQTSLIKLIIGFLQDNTLSSLLLVTHDIKVIRQILEGTNISLNVVFFDGGRSVENLSFKRGSFGDIHQNGDLYEKWQEPSAKVFFESFREKQKSEATQAPENVNTPIMEIRSISKQFGWLKSVDSVSLQLRPGETLGLVGESGAGKTTVGRMLLRLCKSDGGGILLKGTDVWGMEEKKFRQEVQMVFQNPDVAMNSMMKVNTILEEAAEIGNPALSRQEIKEEVKRLLKEVGLDNSLGNRYPFEISGGQKRRLGIARILAIKPKVIVLDEPMAEVDAYQQLQIIELLQKLKRNHNLSYLLISHDLAMIRKMCDSIAVMLRGRIIEFGRKDVICNYPLHPYTRNLLDGKSSPYINELQAKTLCGFLDRCERVVSKCRNEILPPIIPAQSIHQAACHNPLA